MNYTQFLEGTGLFCLSGRDRPCHPISPKFSTDSTPTLEGEAWLLKNGYTQAEGVANLATDGELFGIIKEIN